MKHRKGCGMMVAFSKDLERFRVHPYRGRFIKQYCSRMSKDNLGVLMDSNVAAMLSAQGYSFKEAPRSVYKVDKLYEGLAKYAPGIARSPKHSDSFTAGVALAYACFSRPKGAATLSILPVTPATVTSVTSNPGGSAGLTAFGLPKSQAMTRGLERCLQTLSGALAPEPCIAFKRTQFNDKTRLVWGYPYSMTILEGLVAKGLIEKFKGSRGPMAFGCSSGALGTRLRVASYHKKYAYSVDMSSFDSSVSKELIHIAFKVLRTWYDPDEVEPVSGRTVREVFNIVEGYFVHTPIVMPDGNIYKGKRHGVPSGSFFTQLIDSIVNVIMIGSVSHRFSLHVNKDEIFVLGDDSLFWSNRSISLDRISRWVEENLGLHMHGSAKSSVVSYQEPVHFLGRYWTNGIPDIPIDEIIQRMVYPETFRKYSKDRVARAREARMLLLSYASVYASAWGIASRVINPRPMYYGNGCCNIDVNTFRNARSGDDLKPSMFSGLERFIRTYLAPDKRSSIPVTGYRFWL